MTTPQGPGPSHNPADPPAWGQEPAGGWGQAEPAADDERTQRVDPRAWSQAGQPQPSEPQQSQPAQAGWDEQTQQYGGRQQPPGYGFPPQGDQSQYGQPPYGQPQGGQPQYGQPQYGQPQYGAPHEGQQHPAPPYQQGPYTQGAQPGQGWGPQPGGPQQWGGAPPNAGPGYPPLPGGPAPSGRSKLPLIIGAVVVLVLVVVAVLGFVTPGFFNRKVFDTAAVQSGVQKILTENYAIAGVSGVTCEQNIAVAEGATFTCDATIDGQAVKVPVRVTSSDGNYEVGRPA